jgi:hypothetical protein
MLAISYPQEFENLTKNIGASPPDFDLFVGISYCRGYARNGTPLKSLKINDLGSLCRTDCPVMNQWVSLYRDTRLNKFYVYWMRLDVWGFTAL